MGVCTRSQRRYQNHGAKFDRGLCVGRNAKDSLLDIKRLSIQMNNIRHKCLLSWQILSIGFGLTFLLGLGFSYSNQGIRSDVQSVGLVVFSVLAAIGSYYTVRAFRSY